MRSALSAADRAALIEQQSAQLREEAAHLRASHPYYRLSFTTCDDSTDMQFVPPRYPKLPAEAKAVGQRMAVELLETALEAQCGGFPNQCGHVIGLVLARCRSAWVRMGFLDVIGQAVYDSAELFTPADWLARKRWLQERAIAVRMPAPLRHAA